MTAALQLGEEPDLSPAMALSQVPLRFQIGERTLVRVMRNLVRVTFDLNALMANERAPLIELPAAADGVIVRSFPEARIAELSTQAGDLLVYVRDRFPRHYARLDGSFEAYLASFSSKTRSTLKRKSRKFAELSGGELDIREYRTPAEIEVFHTLARDVSRLTYQERLLDAGLPDTSEYLAQMMRLAAEDRARGYLLFLEGRPVSYLYTPIIDGCAIYAYLGYDPTLATHSPGTVLQLAAMERLFGERRFKMFDFTEGDGQHKRQFATDRFDCANVILLRPTLANRLLIASHGAFQRGVETAGALAERTGLKARLKKLLRG